MDDRSFKLLYIRELYIRLLYLISDGWKATSITEVLSSYSLVLEPLDPFQVTDPLATEKSNMEIHIRSTKDENIFSWQAKTKKRMTKDTAG